MFGGGVSPTSSFEVPDEAQTNKISGKSPVKWVV